MEFYHNQMRLRLMNEKDPNVYQRADWLVDKLGTKVHSYFWLDEYSGKDDFARYSKDEWLSGLTAWRKSLKIPDTNIVMEGECVRVVDQEDQDTVHVIWNPGSEFAICDCNWATRGNLCEHVIKTIKVYRQKGYTMSSVSMFQYNQALVNMLRCPPYDSLIRDHAVSLAVWVETLLNSQIGQDNNMVIVNPEKEQITGSHDRDVANEYHYRNGNMSSQLENGYASPIRCYSTDSERVAVSNNIADESHTCNEDGVGQTCVEMQIDPSSISNSITIDQDLMKNLPSAHADFVNKSSGEDMLGNNGSETIRDTEMESIDVPSSATSSDQCTKIHQVLSSDVVGENGGLGQEESATKENSPTSKDHILIVNTPVDHIHASAVDLKMADIAEASSAIEKIVRTDLGDGDTSLTPSMDSPVDIIN